MAQTRPSPTLSRGFTRLGRFLGPYGIWMRPRNVSTHDHARHWAMPPQLIAAGYCCIGRLNLPCILSRAIF